MSQRNLKPILAAFAALIFASAAAAQTVDLRNRYGTKSLEAARAIAGALQSYNQKKYADALAENERAIKADPQCAWAHFEHAMYLEPLGKVRESLAAYEQCLKVVRPWDTEIRLLAEMNMALTLGELKRHDESNIYFTRAIITDAADRQKNHWKAYRNMAINLHQQERYLSAALAAIRAYRADSRRVDERMIRGYIEDCKDEEAASLLFFPSTPPKIAKRHAPSKLESAAIGGDAIEEKISDLLPDPRGRWVVALVPNESHYYVISIGAKLTAKKISLSEPVACGSMTDDKLYLIVGKAPTLCRVEPMTGHVLRSLKIKLSTLPRSVAVLPAHRAAYVPVKRMLHRVDLMTGKTTGTEIDGQFVVAHPSQKFVYSYLKPERGARGRSVMVLVNGQPVFVRFGGMGSTDWTQSRLFRSVVVPSGLMLAGVRDNAVSNARRIVVSGDGKWVAVVGGGGWRPKAKHAKGSGYGVPVFSDADISRVQGFFKTDAYPLGAAFNPVTGQIATVREADIRVYHLTDAGGMPVVFGGGFSGTCAWSGNGQYLLAAGKVKGVHAYSNVLTAAEQKLAATWWQGVKAGKSSPPTQPAAPKPLAMFKAFTVKEDRSAAVAMLALAIRQRRTDLPQRWSRCETYTRVPNARKEVLAGLRGVNNPSKIGMMIFNFKEMVKKYPAYVPPKYFLATALHRAGQREQAGPYYLQVVRADAGRTNLTCLSLDALHDVHAKKNKPMAAIYCLAASLYVDLANPRTLALVPPLLRQNKLDTQEQALAKLLPSLVINPPASKLPALPVPPAESPKYSAEKLFQKAVTSTVLIKAGGGVGTGVCIGKAGLILTNHHVVRIGGIEVWAYESRDGKVVRREKTGAKVIFRSDRHDLAVLELRTVPAAMKPLPVSARNPIAGQKVYAIGNPGLGEKILAQTISEGIISSNSRTIEGNTYLQHTAAINPGNSGGPLLNEMCQVVGINTLKVSLENVSFAIPAEVIRKIFPSK